MYQNNGEPNDILVAIDNFTQAANAGSAHAQNELAEIYLDQILFTEEEQAQRDVHTKDAVISLPDLNKAIYWFIEAAHNGSPAAQGTLSQLYRLGVGLPQDFVKAYVWQNIHIAAMLAFNPTVASGFGRKLIYDKQSNRDNLYKLLTDKQKNQAQKLTKEYSEKYLVAPTQLDPACGKAQRMIALNNIILIQKLSQSP